MKALTMNLTVAAALMVVAGSASAQALKAVIAFPFHAGESGMVAGTYRIKTVAGAGGKLITLNNVDENRTVMVLSSNVMDAPNRSTQPVLTFVCRDKYCELESISPGYGENAIKLPTSPAARPGRADLRVVTVSATKAD